MKRLLYCLAFWPTALLAQQEDVDVFQACVEQTILDTAHTNSTGITGFQACMDGFSPTYAEVVRSAEKLNTLADLMNVSSTQMLNRLTQSSEEVAEIIATDLRDSLDVEFGMCMDVRGSRPINTVALARAKCRVGSEFAVRFYILDKLTNQYAELP